MVVNTKMNCHSWHKLELMHNIIDSKRRNMTEFASKWGSRHNHCH
jgi:hypothetical protein